jgi:hypothetical protein
MGHKGACLKVEVHRVRKGLNTNTIIVYPTLPSYVSTQPYLASNDSKIHNAVCHYTNTLHKPYLITVHSFELGAFKNLLMRGATLSGLFRCRW